MVQSTLGDSIDIHGGGLDLMFPHHENEIAQSEGATEKPFVKYWMHNNMITFGDRKMSKSLGNIKTAREFMRQYNAEILKYMILSVHYRSLSDFSAGGISQSISGLARVYSSLQLAGKFIAGADANAKLGGNANQGIAAIGKVAPILTTTIEKADKDITEALNDDFNTPEVFAALFGSDPSLQFSGALWKKSQFWISKPRQKICGMAQQ